MTAKHPRKSDVETVVREPRRLLIGRFDDDETLLVALFTDWHHIGLNGPHARRVATIIAEHARDAGFDVMLPSDVLPDTAALTVLATSAGVPTLLFAEAKQIAALRDRLVVRPAGLIICTLGRAFGNQQVIDTDRQGAWTEVGGMRRALRLERVHEKPVPFRIDEAA